MSSTNDQPARPSDDDGDALAASRGSADFTVNVDRAGRRVRITLTAADDYRAIELFDSLVASMNRGGGINLTATRTVKTPGAD